MNEKILAFIVITQIVLMITAVISAVIVSLRSKGYKGKILDEAETVAKVILDIGDSVVRAVYQLYSDKPKSPAWNKERKAAALEKFDDLLPAPFREKYVTPSVRDTAIEAGLQRLKTELKARPPGVSPSSS